MRFEHLSAGYGSKPVLHDISFDLPPEKLTVLIGKNGCGKSTLLACAAGQLAFSGRILLGGRPLNSLSLRERARRIAVLPQLLPTAAVEVQALVEMGRTPYLGLTRRLQPEDRAKVEAALSLTGITALRHQPLSALSGGERQKAFLAMILAQDADILLLDEPTTYMDMGYTTGFLTLLRELAACHGKTLLAVLHDLNSAVSAADHLLLMENGRLRFAGPAADCAKGCLIEEVFGVRKSACIEAGKIRYFYH